jgi:hypothetical protein
MHIKIEGTELIFGIWNISFLRLQQGFVEYRLKMIQPSTVLINEVHEIQIECENLTQRQKIGLPQMRPHPNQTAATHCNPNKTLGTVRVKPSTLQSFYFW